MRIPKHREAGIAESEVAMIIPQFPYNPPLNLLPHPVPRPPSPPPSTLRLPSAFIQIIQIIHSFLPSIHHPHTLFKPPLLFAGTEGETTKETQNNEKDLLDFPPPFPRSFFPFYASSPKALKQITGVFKRGIVSAAFGFGCGGGGGGGRGGCWGGGVSRERVGWGEEG